jgi:hypothetical protein
MPSVAVPTVRGYHRNRDDASVLTRLHVGGIDPDVELIAVKRTVEEDAKLPVASLMEPADLALGDAAHAHRLDQIVNRGVYSGTTVMPGPCDAMNVSALKKVDAGAETPASETSSDGGGARTQEAKTQLLSSALSGPSSSDFRRHAGQERGARGAPRSLLISS